MVSPQDQNKREESNRKALRFVSGMGLSVLIVVTICALIWWFTSSRSFNTLGLGIMIAGGGLLLIGVSNLGGHYHTGLRKYIGMRKEGNRIVNRGENLRSESHMESQVVLSFLGSGLLCLFIGYLIVIGL